MHTNRHLFLSTMSLAVAGSLTLLPTVASAQTTTTTTTNQPAAPAPAPAPAPATSPTPVIVNQNQQGAPTPTVPPPQTYTPPASEPAPAGEDPHYEEVADSYNAAMFTSGALVFAASYGASAIVASQDSNRGNNRLFVPVLGPWLALGDRGSCDINKSSCDHETTAKVLLVADGIFQAAGIVGMLDAVIQPGTHRVAAHVARNDKKIHVTPTVTNGSPGLAALGRF